MSDIKRLQLVLEHPYLGLITIHAVEGKTNTAHVLLPHEGTEEISLPLVRHMIRESGMEISPEQAEILGMNIQQHQGGQQ